jgi:hypothetical protein
MIIYDLKCERNHQFEGWFKDIASFEKQRTDNLVTCPVCGTSKIEMSPSSITTISGRDIGSDNKTSKEISPLMALKLLHEYIDREFDDVSDRFAEVALSMHKGKETKRNIKGTVCTEDEKTLEEEGVQFIKIPLPEFDS